MTAKNRYIYWDEKNKVNCIFHIVSFEESFFKEADRISNIQTIERECASAFNVAYGFMTGKFNVKDVDYIVNDRGEQEILTSDFKVKIVNAIMRESFLAYDLFIFKLLRNVFLKDGNERKISNSQLPGLDIKFIPEMRDVLKGMIKKGQTRDTLLPSSESVKAFYATYLLTIQSVYFYLNTYSIGDSDIETPMFQLLAFMAQKASENKKDMFLVKTIAKAMTLLGDFKHLLTPLNRSLLPGKFSTIKNHELALISKRDKSVEKKYGSKNIEKIFEIQLSLIMQSFGFFVVSTKIGEKSVDMICISNDMRRPSTILIEAKTSTKPYSLPSKDDRALHEYIKSTRASLTTLPPLSLVIIVGQEPSKTLNSKIRILENKAGVPIRYLKASFLAELREQNIRPLGIIELLKFFTDGDHIISKETVRSIIKHEVAQNDAHSQIVEALMKINL